MRCPVSMDPSYPPRTENAEQLVEVWVVLSRRTVQRRCQLLGVVDFQLYTHCFCDGEETVELLPRRRRVSPEHRKGREMPGKCIGQAHTQ